MSGRRKKNDQEWKRWEMKVWVKKQRNRTQVEKGSIYMNFNNEVSSENETRKVQKSTSSPPHSLIFDQTDASTSFKNPMEL